MAASAASFCTKAAEPFPTALKLVAKNARLRRSTADGAERQAQPLVCIYGLTGWFAVLWRAMQQFRDAGTCSRPYLYLREGFAAGSLGRLVHHQLLELVDFFAAWFARTKAYIRSIV